MKLNRKGGFVMI